MIKVKRKWTVFTNIATFKPLETTYFSLLPHTAIPERSKTCSTFQTFSAFHFFLPLQSQNEVKHVICFKRSGFFTSPHIAIPERSDTCYTVQTFWAFHFFLTLQSQNEVKHVLLFKRSVFFHFFLKLQSQNEVKHVIRFKRSGLFTSSSHCNPRTKWNMFYGSNVLGLFSLLPHIAIQERSETCYMFQTFWAFHFSSQCNSRTKWNMLYCSNVLGFPLLPHIAIPERSETCSTFQTFWAFHFFLTLQSQNEVKHSISFKRSGCLTSSPHCNPRTKWNMLYCSNILGLWLLLHIAIPERSETCSTYQTFWDVHFFLTLQSQNEVKHVICFKRSGFLTSSSHCNPRQAKHVILFTRSGWLTSPSHRNPRAKWNMFM
jgi:hypothetical protein